MARSTDNLFLIGPMGAGKTTIGRQLARQLNMEFIDSDRAIEERTGVDIPLIFEKEGEAGFRRREREMIDELTTLNKVVLATGGGAVLDADNRARLSARGKVVYLSSDLDSLVERTSRDRNRPLLHGEEPPAVVLEKIMAMRDPLYRETADIIVDTSRSSIRHVIKAIMDALEAGSGEGSSR